MEFIVFFIIVIGSIVYINSKSKILTSNYNTILKSYFDRLLVIHQDSNVTLYSADKDAENFLIETTSLNRPITASDIMTLVKAAQKNHIHNKIIITNFPIDSTLKNSKTFKESEIMVWNSATVASLVKDLNSELRTSDTSDDTCKIDTDSNDPIQDGAFSTHGIFSIFNNKVDHL